MSKDYAVNVSGSNIEAVIGNYPEIAACIAAGVSVKPMNVAAPEIDFHSYKSRADAASPESSPRPKMKR